MIEYKRIENDGYQAEYIAVQISSRLSNGQKVLWLVAGGSAMDIAVKTAERLKDSPNLANLTITLTDERYGRIGHADSNWNQLMIKGFSLPGAKLRPVLINKSLEETARVYGADLENALEKADYSIALAGMGADGHIFGIKPGSPAVNSKEMVAGYEWTDYVRLTPTINLLSKLDEIIIYAAGEEKHKALDELDKDIDPKVQPAQLLKRLKHVTVYNDYKGERV